MSRDHVLSIAQTWLGTPYRHQGSLRQVACDCLGLIRGIWREVYGPEPEALPAYGLDWAESGPGEPLLDACQRYLVPVDLDQALPGDVLLFRMSPEAAIKHCAVLCEGQACHGPSRIIHAYWGHSVVRSWLGDWWRRRLVAAFSFPEAE